MEESLIDQSPKETTPTTKNEFLSKFRDRLPRDGKKLVSLIVIVLAIPITIILALTQQDFYNRAAAPSVKSASTGERPIVGAIRWDGWYGNKNNDRVGVWVEKMLGPEQWHYRVPFFGTISSATQVKLGYSQEIIDQEIAYAKHAGLSYWAFLYGNERGPLSDAFKYYLSSTHKNDVNFSLIFSSSAWGYPDSSPESQRFSLRKQRFIELMKEPNYQKVLGNRPLVYLGFIDDAWAPAWGGSPGVKNMIAQFRTDAQNAGLGNPYIVIMDGWVDRGEKYIKDFGADAISAYLIADWSLKNAPHSILVTREDTWSNTAKSKGLQVIPNVTVGLDERPVVQNPPPWNDHVYPPDEMEKFYQHATPQEVANHVAHALDWIKQNPDNTRANTVLMYAWNENAEGGWIVPTLSEGTARIDAIARVLVPPISTPFPSNPPTISPTQAPRPMALIGGSRLGGPINTKTTISVQGIKSFDLFNNGEKFSTPVNYEPGTSYTVSVSPAVKQHIVCNSVSYNTTYHSTTSYVPGSVVTVKLPQKDSSGKSIVDIVWKYVFLTAKPVSTSNTLGTKQNLTPTPTLPSESERRTLCSQFAR